MTAFLFSAILSSFIEFKAVLCIIFICNSKQCYIFFFLKTISGVYCILSKHLSLKDFILKAIYILHNSKIMLESGLNKIKKSRKIYCTALNSAQQVPQQSRLQLMPSVVSLNFLWAFKGRSCCSMHVLLSVD